MKANAKRLFTLLLALVLLCGALCVPAGAATPEETEAAHALYKLGLLKGSGRLPEGGPNFDLDGKATRAQAAVMLTRLRGAEREAKKAHYSHPFKDAGWAGDYIGYVYQKGITKGMGNGMFGSDLQIDAAQFVTLVLRMLGYSKVNWRDPYPTADEVGLAYSGIDDFRRRDMVTICYSALSCQVKGTGQTLRQQLEAAGVIKAEEPAGIRPGPVPPAAEDRCTVSSGEEVQAKLLAACNARISPLVLTGPVSVMGACQNAVDQVLDLCPDLTGFGYTISYDNRTMVMTVTLAYNDAVEIMAYLEGRRSSLSQANTQTLEKARQVHDSLANNGMSEYDRVKAFHDYLVNNTSYGGSNDRKFTAGGALVDGRAVCDGYSMALDLLCYLSGIDCVRVTGNAGGPHAWNKVKVDGNWYNIDVTWDDPVGSYPMLTYDYFLISDSAIARDHTQEQNASCPAAPNSWGEQ